MDWESHTEDPTQNQGVLPTPRSAPALGLRPIPFSLTILLFGLLAAATFNVLYSTTLRLYDRLGIETGGASQTTLSDNPTTPPLHETTTQSVLTRLKTSASALRAQPIRNVTALLIGSLAWLLFCIPLSRCAALRHTRQIDLTFRQALSDSGKRRRIGSHYPLLVFSPLLILTLVNGLIGLIAQIPWIGPFLLVPLYLLAFASAAVLVLLGLGGIAGIGLATASLVSEREAALNAITRTFSYFFARPVLYVFYHGVILLFAISLWGLTNLIFELSLESLGSLHNGDSLQTVISLAQTWSIPQNLASATFPEWCAGGVLRFLVLVGQWLASGLALAFFFSGTTVVYFRLRWECDGVSERELMDRRGLSPADQTSSSSLSGSRPDRKSPEPITPRSTFGDAGLTQEEFAGLNEEELEGIGTPTYAETQPSSEIEFSEEDIEIAEEFGSEELEEVDRIDG